MNYMGWLICIYYENLYEINYNKIQTGYIVTNYLPNGNKGDGTFEGVDLDYVLSYFKNVKCYVRDNNKGIWIEAQYLSMSKCNELKNTLGSWLYEIINL